MFGFASQAGEADFSLRKHPRKLSHLLARLVAYGSGSRKNLRETIGDSTIPLLVLEKTGDIAVATLDALEGEIVSVVPESVAESLEEKLFTRWASGKWLQGKAPKIPWFGERCVFAKGMIQKPKLNALRSLEAVEQLHKAWLDVSHVLTQVRFLSPNKKNQLPAPPRNMACEKLC